MDVRPQVANRVHVLQRDLLADVPHWQHAFRGKRKDHRYYEILEDTLGGYAHLYFVISDAYGAACAIQPAFLLDQDLVAGVDRRAVRVVDAVRRMWPRFLKLRTLMIGCVAGEGHLDDAGDEQADTVRALAAAAVAEAKRIGAPLVVFKEFPAAYRRVLADLVAAGFARIPSMPMTRRFIGYDSFDDYMVRALGGSARRKLRKKFKKAANAPPIAMSVVTDISDIIDEMFGLYLAVYERSKLHFEKLTPAYFREVGRRMPDTARFFIWRQQGKIVAFTLAMLEGRKFYAEYVGLDYRIAFDVHLWHVVVRDMTNWAIANGFEWFCSSGLNYDPKLHLRHELDPIDLYVRHTSPVANALLRRVLPLVEPTRYDPTLKKFSNYSALWG